MIENLTFRQAAFKDIDFVIEGIIEADKSGTDIISMCRVFSISEGYYREILFDILKQDIRNYDYYMPGFLICETDGEYAGTVGAWIEGANGIASGMIKSSIILQFLGEEKFPIIKNNLEIIKDFSVSRLFGALQVEYVYIKEKYRGRGIFDKMVGKNIKRNLDSNSFNKVQSVLLKSNTSSYSAFSKFGYKVVVEKKSENPKILNFFPYNTRILMELDMNNFNSDKY